MKRCVVIGGAPVDLPINSLIKRGDTIICADKGWQTVKSFGIEPDLIVGDFDSSPRPSDASCPVIVLPVEKDDTDTHHIANYIVENGFTDALFLGVLGGARPDHTFATYQTLIFLARHRVNATAVADNCTVFAIVDGEVLLKDNPGRFLSVFCVSGAAFGVSIEGAKYSIRNAKLTNFYPLGVSNEFCGSPVRISVVDGELLIMLTKKD